MAGVIAALAVGALLFWVGAQQKRIAAMDAYLRLDARLESRSVINARSAVSGAYLACTGRQTLPDRDKISFVMKHFEAIAFAVRHKIIDKHMVWSWIGDPLLAYHQAFIDVVGKEHRDEPTSWEDLAWLVPKLAAINVKRNVRDWPGGYPGEPAIKAIMKRESALADQLRDPGMPDYFAREILPGLQHARRADIVTATGVSKSCASDIRAGKYTPPVATWSALADLVGARHSGHSPEWDGRTSSWR